MSELRVGKMTRDEIESFEKIFGMMHGIHVEIGALAKKSPNDGINKFKLGFINASVRTANAILVEGYLPFDDFDGFNPDDLPTNSDVTFIIGQYLEELERMRADSIRPIPGSVRWVYKLPDGESHIYTAPPRKTGDRK